MILKNADDLQPQIDELNDLRTQATSPRQITAIQRQIDDMVVGRRGEAGVARHLAIAFEDDADILVLHDVRLEVGSVSAQIDHIVITTGEVCCLETKNMQTPVSIEEDGSWFIDGVRGKQRIDSPAKQASEHALVLGRWLAAHGIHGARPTPAVVVNSKLDLDGNTDWVDVEIVRAERIADWIKGSRRLRPDPDARIEGGDRIAQSLRDEHRPLRVAWHAHFGLQRSVNRQAEPTEHDINAATRHLQDLAAKSRAAAAQRFLLDEIDGGGRGFNAMVNAIAGLHAAPTVPQVQVASTHGPIMVSALPSGQYAFHPQGDQRLKKYIRRCAREYCSWSGAFGSWRMQGSTAVTTLATMLADVREERSRPK
jgi:hypothetical protein